MVSKSVKFGFIWNKAQSVGWNQAAQHVKNTEDKQMWSDIISDMKTRGYTRRRKSKAQDKNTMEMSAWG